MTRAKALRLVPSPTCGRRSQASNVRDGATSPVPQAGLAVGNRIDPASVGSGSPVADETDYGWNLKPFLSGAMSVQLTLVSHYGPKGEHYPELRSVISALHTRLSESLGPGFRACDLDQVHGTIVGLEGVPERDGIHSLWFKENFHKDRKMDFEGLLECLRSGTAGEFTIRVGGWKPAEEYGFLSRGQHPYLRSFSIRGGIAVAMGWPFRKGRYCRSLYRLRKRLETFGTLHKWHTGEFRDNDFFFVLGRITADGVDESVLASVSKGVREMLETTEHRVEISRETLSLVAYVDPELPRATSKTFSLTDPAVTPGFLEGLYRDEIGLGSREVEA